MDLFITYSVSRRNVLVGISRVRKEAIRNSESEASTVLIETERARVKQSKSKSFGIERKGALWLILCWTCFVLYVTGRPIGGPERPNRVTVNTSKHLAKSVCLGTDFVDVRMQT